MKKTVEYKISGVDCTENDTYFDVDGRKNSNEKQKNEPTIADALEFFERDSKFYKE